jgi:predicted metal-dependent enzyme (double-stranded beta helix superfamily)
MEVSMERNNLPSRIREFVASVHDGGSFTPDKARKLLAGSGIQTEDLTPWTDYTHPRADSYGRKLVYDGGFFELMVMSWVDGDMSTIHDHGYTQWGAVKLFGPAEHAIFKIDDGTLVTYERRQFEPGSVVAVSHDLIHQMGNNGQDPYVTLHLYGCHDRVGGVTADARLYDLEAGEIQFTDGGVFFDLTETRINKRATGPRADFATWLRFQVELLRRLFLKHDTIRKRKLNPGRESRVAHVLFEINTWRKLERELAGEDSTSNSNGEKYWGILEQELLAAAQLQMQMIEAALVKSSIDRSAIKQALESSSSAFVEAYCEILNATFGLELEVRQEEGYSAV